MTWKKTNATAAHARPVPRGSRPYIATATAPTTSIAGQVAELTADLASDLVPLARAQPVAHGEAQSHRATVSLVTARNGDDVVAANQVVLLTRVASTASARPDLLLGAQPQHGGDDEAARDHGHEHEDVAPGTRRRVRPRRRRRRR